MVTSYFQFSVRTVIHNGAGSRTKLPELIKDLGGKRVILFTDKGLTKAGVTEKITDLFELMPGDVELAGVFDDIVQDAKSSVINQAVRFFKENNGDALLALGGGSVLDTVKGVKWMLDNKFSDIHEHLLGSVLESWPDVQPSFIPHVAVPTTAGTGAEVSPISVIFHENANVKVSIIHPFINADLAVLDPELTVGLPPKITAFTGFDALTHAIEAYFSPDANPMTDAYALQSTRMIKENIETAVHEGENIKARANMLMASSMAISAFSLALNAIPVHNLAHALGARYGIPHGLANAVLLPNVMESLPSIYLPRIKGFAEALRIENISDSPEKCLEQVTTYIRDLRSQIGLANTFEEVAIDHKQLEEIVTAVQSDPSGVFFRIPEEIIANVVNEVAGSEIKL
ncbi:iron-containing alcohol dehydrogenase [Halobacillus shinanisalinarum]|uniref:Iron-containing alcohol dehydrogenase n=1 Tax=Halobacillus shinanisalinarum TaxID=2932258 RepID=A0ABY4H2G2_9BACI|nr:iron-containing alcohol dehydrogenase [Halobacillus shinanisalinarum]UOQ94613.1 iron-containing alcohol dehydrogenase [Halobacillus shinanisalinarum]